MDIHEWEPWRLELSGRFEPKAALESSVAGGSWLIPVWLS